MSLFLTNAPTGIGNPVISGTANSVLFIDSNGKLGQDNALFSWTDSTNQLSVTSVASPGGTLQAAVVGVHANSISGADILVGVEGVVTNQGGNAVTTGHCLGVIGLFQDVATSVAPGYGVEGRCNSISTSTTTDCCGVLGLGTHAAATFSGTLSGIKVRAEITTDGTTPATAGTLKQLWIVAPIGGGSANNSWAIYSESTNPSLFSGTLQTTALGVGGSLASLASIYVNGFPTGALTAGIYIAGNSSGGTNYGLLSSPMFNATTTAGIGVYGRPDTAAVAFTLTGAYSLYADNPNKGAGSTITTAYGLYLNNITAGTTNYSIFSTGGQCFFGGKFTTYNNVTTAGWGVPGINGSGRSTAQTAAVASVAAYTVGAADGSFIVSGNVLVSTSTTHSFNLQVTYTDEGNTSRTVTMNVQQLGGTLVTSITNITGAGPYEGVPLHIRCKASTAITILTSGTFTSVTYNVDGNIMQIS